MNLWISFLVMIVVALISMAVMGIVYLDKCIRSIKQTGKKVTFGCVITVAMWVALAVILDAVAC